jgi:hypothetical protein
MPLLAQISPWCDYRITRANKSPGETDPHFQFFLLIVNYIPVKMAEIVGLEVSNNLRSSLRHTVCGAQMKISTLLPFKFTLDESRYSVSWILLIALIIVFSNTLYAQEMSVREVIACHCMSYDHRWPRGLPSGISPNILPESA